MRLSEIPKIILFIPPFAIYLYIYWIGIAVCGVVFLMHIPKCFTSTCQFVKECNYCEYITDYKETGKRENLTSDSTSIYFAAVKYDSTHYSTKVPERIYHLATEGEPLKYGIMCYNKKQDTMQWLQYSTWRLLLKNWLILLRNHY